MEQMIVEYNRPVFSVHDKWNAEHLARICENNNRRCLDTGDKVPLILGHTDPSKPECEQPEIVGYASDFKVAMHGKLNPRPCITCKFEFYPDKYAQHDIKRQYPRCSVELWQPVKKDGELDEERLDELYFDPIAILGPTTPELDLGLMGDVEVFSRRKYRYSIPTYTEETHMPDAREDFVKDCLSKLMETAEIQFVKQLMKERTTKAAEDEEADEEAEAMAKAEGEEASQPDEDNDKMSKPEDNKEKSEPKAKDDGEVLRFQKENTALKAEFDVLLRKFRRSEREKELVKMEANEGIVMVLEDELNEVQDMSDEVFGKYQAKLRKNYQRAPIGHINVANTDNYGKREITATDINKAVELCIKKGLSYDDALKTIGGI